MVAVVAAVAMGWRNPSVVGDEDFLVAVGEFCDGGAEGHVNAGADIAGTQRLDGQVRIDLANNLRRIAIHKVSIPVQQDGDNAVSVNRRLIAAQLRHGADNGDDAPDEAVEVRRRDAGGRHLLRHGCFSSLLLLLLLASSSCCFFVCMCCRQFPMRASSGFVSPEMKKCARCVHTVAVNSMQIVEIALILRKGRKKWKGICAGMPLSARYTRVVSSRGSTWSGIARSGDTTCSVTCYGFLR